MAGIYGTYLEAEIRLKERIIIFCFINMNINKAVHRFSALVEGKDYEHFL